MNTPAPKNAAAAALGQLGGKARTPAKRAAAIANGSKGGRPRKVTTPVLNQTLQCPPQN